MMTSYNPEYDVNAAGTRFVVTQETGALTRGVSELVAKIGIGEDRRSRSFPSHTTRHAGPHLAVR